jgi:replicative DNA helicase
MTTAIDYERSVIGAILADNSQVMNVDLLPRDFAVGTHAQIYEAARRQIGSGKATDALTLAEALESETGRRDWLPMTVAIQRECLAPSNAARYAAIVRKASLSRQAAMIGERLVSGGGDEISDAIRALIELGATNTDHSCHVSEAMKLAADELQAAADGKSPGVTTGIRDLDDALGGFHNDDLIVVAARPSMGKTAFMLNSACAANVGVGVFSGEQGRAQIGMRLLAIEGPVSLHRMRLGKLDDDEWSRVAYVMNVMQRRPLWIYDKPSPSIDEIVSQARAWKFHNNIGMVMVDYLQIIRGGRGQDFRFQVGDITQQLKDLARELKIPVIALSQVKRAVEERPMGDDGLGCMPYMSDIAEASIIEQIADQIITLYRPEVYEDRPEFKGIAYFNACKNRHGPVGHKAMSWRGEYLKFGDLARTEMAHQDRWSAAS